MGDWTLPPQGGHMESADQIYLQNMTWKQIDARLKQNDIIIVPIGSTEAHGPHACIGEDTFLVTRMAEAIAQKTGCTVAQPMWYGSHPYHHMGMPGTIIVPEETFVGYIKAIMVGLWNMGFRKQILLNGHGQEYVIPTAIHQFAKTFQVPGVFINVNWYHAIQEYFKTVKDGG
ncbi:MAG TPA: 3-dehydro-scyllo-inosose hydrolase, partial [Candidatus Methylomirabilis sp.]